MWQAMVKMKISLPNSAGCTLRPGAIWIQLRLPVSPAWPSGMMASWNSTFSRKNHFQNRLMFSKSMREAMMKQRVPRQMATLWMTMYRSLSIV